MRQGRPESRLLHIRARKEGDMEKDTRVELTEERVREIAREEIGKIMVDMTTRALEERIKIMKSISV